MICSNCESTEFACGGCGVNFQPEDEGCTGEGRGRGHTYTASEVKVLTETASKVAYALGRKDALEDAEAAIDAKEVWFREQHQPYTADGCSNAAMVVREMRSQPSQASPDATSGVPGHPEVSEAVRSPQEPCGHPTCPCAEGITP